MALTATVTITTAATTIPAGYSIPVLPAITAVGGNDYSVDIAISEADASNAVTGITNVVAAVKAQYEATQGVLEKLDVAQTISANLTITNLLRMNTDTESIFITGVEVFRCAVSYEYQ